MMRCRNQQRGMTIWGLTFVLAVLAFVLFLLFKLFPPYMNDFKVRNALNSTAQDQNIVSMTKGQIREALYKRFDIDMIGNVNLTENFSVESRGRTKVIRITYEVIVPMVFNISALLEFDHVREVRAIE